MFDVSWNSSTKEIWAMDMDELISKLPHTFDRFIEESWTWTAPETGEYFFTFNNFMGDQAATNVPLNDITITSTSVPEPSMMALLVIMTAFCSTVFVKRKKMTFCFIPARRQYFKFN